MQPETIELMADTVQYLAVVLIGGFIGIGELVSRYKDDPFEAITNRHAVTYTLLNILASSIALLALKTMKTDAVLGEGSASERISYALMAGFGAMGVLRSSAFTMRVGKDDIAIGPSALLQVMLSATDRAVDRARARVRAEMMAKTMQAMPFEQIDQALPQLAFTMMQNVTQDEKQSFADEVERLRDKKMDPVAKSICLGLSLSNIVGQGVVDDAVTALRKTLLAAGDPAFAAAQATPPPPPMEGGKAESVAPPPAPK
jgi:Tfp pilus assembly protein PilV